MNIIFLPNTWKEYKTEKSGLKMMEMLGRILMILSGIITFGAVAYYSDDKITKG